MPISHHRCIVMIVHIPILATFFYYVGSEAKQILRTGINLDQNGIFSEEYSREKLAPPFVAIILLKNRQDSDSDENPPEYLVFRSNNQIESNNNNFDDHIRPNNSDKALINREGSGEKMVLRIWKSCSKKAAKLCKKACKAAVKVACQSHSCKKKLKKALKKECKRECKDRFQTDE